MASGTSKRDATRAHYDDAASRLPGFSVLNYGFHDSTVRSIVPGDEPERFCLQLYEHVVSGTPLEGADVLEVSCGRGGGAAFLARVFSPRRMLGLDLSGENVRLARTQHAAKNIEFAVGDAEALDLPDETFDVVINVEASHLYENRKAFFAEAFRVLRPGGRLCYADGCWRNDDLEPDLLAAGFRRLARRDITSNVLEALNLDSPRREAAVQAIEDPALRDAYRDWSGVVGHRAHKRLESGETLYYSFVLERPESG